MKPFEIIQHSTDSEQRPMVNICGIVLSNEDSIKLRDELNRLIPPTVFESAAIALERMELIYSASAIGDQAYNQLPLPIGLIKSALPGLGESK